MPLIGASDNRLKNAEDKISNLMQELEELRFFHEIDITSPSPNNTLTPLPLSSLVETTTKNIASQSPVQQPRKDVPPLARISQQQLQQQPRMSPLTHSARLSSPMRRPMAGGVPIVASSRPILSPRRISSLDRTSLELETQELQRRVHILEQETSSMAATIEMCQQEIIGKDEDVQRVHTLEDTLKEVRSELSNQLQEMHHGRALLLDQYEGKLEQMRLKYTKAKDQAEDMAMEITEMKNDMDKLEENFKSKEEQAKIKLQQQVEAADQRESALELQLSEATMQLDSINDTLEDQARLVTKVESDVLETTKRLEYELREQQERFNLKLRDLEEQLKESKILRERLETERLAQQQQLQQREEELASHKSTNQLQSTRLSELEAQNNMVADKYKNDMEALKKMQDDRERQRLDNVVQSNHAVCKEMEDRMADLQMQLKLANDRHETEMHAKDADIGRRLERDVDVAIREATTEYQITVVKLQEELQLMTTHYEQAREDYLRVEVQAESRDRNMAREWERKDGVRQSELDRLNDKLDKAMRDLIERDTKLQAMVDRLVAAEELRKASLSELESQHDESIKAREEILANQRKTFKASEATLRIELARKESIILQLQESTNSRVNTMKHEMEQVRKLLDDKERSRDDFEQQLHNKVDSLQTSTNKAQQDLVLDQARRDALESELRIEMTKLEGKLSESESALKEKRRIIDVLEKRLTYADDAVSTAGSKLHADIFALRRDLDASRELLLKERLLAEGKDRKISEMIQEQQVNNVKLAQIDVLKEQLSQWQQSMENSCKEKSVHMDELNKLLEEQDIAAMTLEETKKKLAVEKEQVSMELMQKQKEIETTIKQFTCTVVEMESKLVDKEKEASSLKEEVEKLKSTLLNTADDSMIRLVSTKGLQDKITELEELVRKQKSEVTMVECDKVQTVDRLQKKLEDAKTLQKEIVRQMNDTIEERNDAVDALEEVIQEVNIREEELDSLVTVLEKRDNELENAKIIAIKALASAQEIKSKYLEKGARESDRHVEFRIQIDELSTSVEFLNDKNDKMRCKTLRLETELREKNLECIRLRDALRNDSQKNDPDDDPIVSNYGLVDQHGFLPLDLKETRKPSKIGKMDEFMLMESGFSMSQSDEPSQDSSFMINESMSTNTADLRGATEWLHDFNSDNASGFGESVDGVRSEPGAQGIARRSVERDTLRKYVRRRYLKQKEKNNAESRSEC